MTTQKDFMEDKKRQEREQERGISMMGENKVLRASLAADVEAFLAAGGKIDVRPGFERICDGSKPVTTINVKKMSERENRERMKKQAESYYKGGKAQ